MPRAARRLQWTDAACYHVLNRGHARETLFHDDQDRSRFLELVGRYRTRFALRIYHYCLMDNHFHVLVQLPDPQHLSRMVAGLLVAYWHHYRRRYGLVGHLFQNRFKSPAIEAETYLLSCGRYIERNPGAPGRARGHSGLILGRPGEIKGDAAQIGCVQSKGDKGENKRGRSSFLIVKPDNASETLEKIKQEYSFMFNEVMVDQVKNGIPFAPQTLSKDEAFPSNYRRAGIGEFKDPNEQGLDNPSGACYRIVWMDMPSIGPIGKNDNGSATYKGDASLKGIANSTLDWAYAFQYSGMGPGTFRVSGAA